MKKLTIRTKIMLWYTVLLVILLGMFFPYLYYTMSQTMYRGIEGLTKAAAAQAVSMVDIEDNNVKFKEDADALMSGTYVAIYSKNNALIYSNSHLPWFTGLSPDYDLIRTVNNSDDKWLIYDRQVLNNGAVIAWIRAGRPLKPVRDTLSNLKFVILLALPVYMAIAILGGLFIAGRALSPIDHITRTAREIGQGNLTKRIRLENSRDEVGRLAETFDEMLDNLEAAFNREKQFASDASHELRTPIAVIMSHAEDALSGIKSESDYKVYMETIYRESQKMGRMVSQLLMLARGYEGKYKLELEDMDLSMLIKNVAEEMMERTLRSDIEISLNLDYNIRIKADQTLITQLLINLIENAVKYNKRNGWIKITLRRERNTARIIVEDNGVGMTKEDLPNIFKRFYRADRSRTGDGTGLGLSIVKWIVDLHNGTISVNSELGRGTVFEIELNISI